MKGDVMKTIFGIYTNGNRTNVEKTSCSISRDKIFSFKFAISPDNIEKVIKDDKELCAYTFDEKKVPSLRRQLLSEKKRSLKPHLSE